MIAAAAVELVKIASNAAEKLAMRISTLGLSLYLITSN